MSNKLRRRQRRGISLIEMVVYISVSGVLLTINTAWIHQSLTYSSAIQKRQRHQQNLQRLANELRDDVQSSRSMKLVGDTLHLQTDDGTVIRYVALPSSITVEKRMEETLVFQDQYEFLPSSIVRWETTETPDWIGLTVYRGPDSLPESMPESNPPTKISIADLPVDLHLRVAPNRWPKK